jgi:hypothetical protein
MILAEKVAEYCMHMYTVYPELVPVFMSGLCSVPAGQLDLLRRLTTTLTDVRSGGAMSLARHMYIGGPSVP